MSVPLVAPILSGTDNSTSVGLSWTPADVAPRHTDYTLYRSSDASPVWVAVYVGTAQNAVQFDDSPPADGTWRYYVHAVDRNDPTNTADSAAIAVRVGAVIADSPGDGFYLTLAEADALAAMLPAAAAPGLTAFTAAGDAQRAALLLMASIDVDGSGRYQGRRYDETGVQILEFPRVPYTSAVATVYPGGSLPSGVVGMVADRVWDWDASANSGQGAAVVPARVKQATLLQAFSLAAGDRTERLQAIADGLASQAVGSLSESYRAGISPNPLCLRAAQLMRPYRMKQGRQR